VNMPEQFVDDQRFSIQPATRQPAQSAVLPVTITRERRQQELSRAARQQIAQMTGPRPKQFLLEIAKIWATIAVVVVIAAYCHNIFVTIAAIVIVAGRQNGLGLLMHEQAHYLGLKSRWGDIITNLLVCYPLLFVNVAGYARIHLTHHRFFFAEQDPDIARKSGDDWAFPMSKRRLAWLFARNLAGLNIITTIIGKNRHDDLPKLKRLGPTPQFTHVLFLIVLAEVLTVTHGWSLFLVYWLLPLVTVLQAFVMLGAICEHVYARSASLESSTAIIIPSWWERLIFRDYNFFYHVYHHYFPGVSFSNLPAVHSIYVREGLVREDRVFHGIYRYLDFLTSGPWAAAEAPETGRPAPYRKGAVPT
jgi:fatty acid desaturase